MPNSILRQMNDHSIGRLTMTVFDIVILACNRALNWLYNVRFPHKRKTFTAIAILALWWMTSDTKDSETVVTEPVAVTAPLEVETPSGPTTYQTGKLAGRKAGDLYASYLGYSGMVIPTELEIDWSNQLESLWSRKSNRRGITPVARQAHQALVTEYIAKDPGRISLESYQAIAGNQAKAICTELDWGRVGNIYRLNGRETKLLKRVSCNMGGRVLLAYTMAELLPSADGDLNRDYLDFMLRHGGRRYVESLPAVHDNITSFGPVQFTQYAVYDAGGEIRGASKVNLALPAQLKIPGSTLYLRENDHFKAAYLFAVSNLADGIRGLNSKQLATFEQVAGPRGVDVAQYIATAHNKPAVARKSLRRWLDNRARSSYKNSCPLVSRLYATKTFNNYKALSPTR